MEYTSVFGPVISGRLGRSLGVDMLNDTICSYDCLYCESGPTTKLTTERRRYVSAGTILEELADWRNYAAEPPQFVTLGGSGEPLLNSDTPAVLDGIRELFPSVERAILTNSTLFIDPTVRAEAAEAEVILPSMDTLVPQEWRRLNRPHPSLVQAGPQAVADGLKRFRAEYGGRIYLEILLARGINDSEENLALLLDFVRDLRPERIDIGSMTRPGAYAAAKPASEETLLRWKDALQGNLSLSAPADPGGDTACYAQADASLRAQSREEDPAETAHRVHSSLRRRPQTAAQLAHGLCLNRTTVDNALETLQKQGHIFPQQGEEESPAGLFYRSAETR